MRSLVIPALAALLPTVLAQTSTLCNPIKEKGCPDVHALGGNATFAFNDTLYPKIWEQKNAGKVDWSEKGATFTIERSGESPQINSKFYLLFGRLEVVMRMAKGKGVISTAILQSEDLDEIDWEFKGDADLAMTNYYGKGRNESTGRGKDFEMDESPHDGFHNYTIDWTKERLQWWLDGKMVRELKYEDADGGNEYPQTPMNARIGIWAAGDKDKNMPGVVEWAGGETNFKEAPFTAWLQSVYAEDYTTGAKAYSWEDMDASGSWEKVKVIEGKSEILEEYQKPSGVRNRWHSLSPGVKAGIIIGCIAAVALGALIILFCCIKQRRAGRKAAAAYEAQQSKEQAELLEYRGAPGANGKMGYNRI